MFSGIGAGDSFSFVSACSSCKDMLVSDEDLGNSEIKINIQALRTLLAGIWSSRAGDSGVQIHSGVKLSPVSPLVQVTFTAVTFNLLTWHGPGFYRIQHATILILSLWFQRTVLESRPGRW